MTDSLDQALTASEDLMRHLYALKKFVTENGKLGEQHDALARGIEALESQRAADQKRSDDLQTEIANRQQQVQQLDQELAARKSELMTARTELKALHASVNQVKTMLEAA